MKDYEGKSWRQKILHFAPSWFSVVMGTGIVSILLYNFPFQARWLRYISIGVTCFNLALFLLCLGISTIRYILYPGLFTTMLHHPVQSLFLGTMPMGLSTLVTMLSNYSAHTHWAQLLAWAFWWVDVALSLATTTTLPFLIMHKHQHSVLNEMTAVWLLPIVPCVVASACGATIALHFAESSHPSLAHLTIWVSYMLWGGGFFMACIVLCMYFHRLTLHQLPPREVIVSVFLPLGPLGQGAFAIMVLAKALRASPPTSIFFDQVGEVVYAVTFLISLTIWGFAIIWLFHALFSITRQRFPFNNGWWAFTFPTGVFALSTIFLGNALESLALKVVGAIFAVTVMVLYCIVAAGTIHGIYAGTIINAPCVLAYESNRQSFQQPRPESS